MKENFEEDKEKKDSKAEPAWYEKRADGTAWFETDFDLEGDLSRGGDKTGEENAREKALPKEEERYFDFSKEEADGETEALNETVFPFSEKETTLPEESAFSKEKTENKEKPSDEGEGGTALPVAHDWEEQGKIYLPDPPPPFELDKIVNQREYIEKNFAFNGALKQMRCGKGNLKNVRGSNLFGWGCIGIGLIVLSGLIFPFVKFLGAAFAAGGFVLLCAKLIFARKKVPYTEKSSEFFLIKPYAAEMEFSPPPSWEGDEVRLHALKLYYIDNGKLGAQIEHQATTDYIYSKKQLDRLVEAFLAGKLVVACRKGFMSELAVICEPGYYLPDDPHF